MSSSSTVAAWPVRPMRPAHRVGLGEDVVAGDPAGAAGRHAQRGQHPDGGGLAGTVGPEQAQHGALGHHEAHAVDGDGVAELLDQVDCLDGQGCGSRGHSSTGHRQGRPGLRRGGSPHGGFTPGLTVPRPGTHRPSGQADASILSTARSTAAWRSSGVACVRAYGGRDRRAAARRGRRPAGRRRTSLAIAGVLPRYSDTSTIACPDGPLARGLGVAGLRRSRPAPTAASTVACQVRKSLAVMSPPVEVARGSR